MTSNDSKVRKQALHNALEAVDVTVELGAEIMVFWNGREGFDFVLAKNGRDSFHAWSRDSTPWAANALKKYVANPPLRHRAEAK